MVLKSPVKSQCENAGLQACGQMTEGVLEVVEGKRTKGLKTIAAAAVKNSPEQLQTFASAVKMLQDIPGADRYAEPLMVVAEALAASTPATPAPSASSTVAASAMGSTSDLMNPYHRRPPRSPTSPRNDRAQLDGGMASPGSIVTPGPFVVMTLVRSSRTCEGMTVELVDVLDVDSIVWRLELDADLPSVRILVDRGHVLRVLGDSNNCGVMWSGYRPAGGGKELAAEP